MRLIHIDQNGILSLVEYVGQEVPGYAILSHTWGADNEEVTFKDLSQGNGNSKIGYGKLEFCQRQATKDRIHYFWVDTCCIDKSSSSELTEAINSMFRWYQNALKCYVYLSDVAEPEHSTSTESPVVTWQKAFQASRWFKRGWTLQELIAPTTVEFFSRDNVFLGNKQSLRGLIHEITMIPIDILDGGPLAKYDIDQRLSWDKNRSTIRPEDAANSLLGFFGIYVPLIYGEGRENAFMRMRNEIDKIQFSNAEERRSIMTWVSNDKHEQRHHDISSVHLKNTGMWLLETPTFQHWRDDSIRGEVVTYYGSPGVGKSVLASSIVNDLTLKFAKTDVAILYLYFDYREGDRQPYTNIISILLKQLLQHQFTLCQRIIDLHRLYKDKQCQASVEELEDVFQTLCTGFQSVYLVVDALDESGRRNRSAFLNFLSALRSNEGIDLKILLTGRPQVVDMLGPLPCNCFVHLEANESDVRQYLETKVGSDGDPEVIDDNLERRIVEVITDRARGTFLLAALQIEFVLDQPTTGDIESALAAYPKSLDEMYRDGVDRVYQQPQSRADLGMRTLMWLTLIKRPLSTQELVECLAIKVNDRDLDRTFCPLPKTILQCCMGFVKVDEASSTVRLVHHSLHEYLRKWESIIFPNGEDTIATLCLTYLMFDSFSGGCSDSRQKLVTRLESCHFLSYAAYYWSHHFKISQTGHSRNLVPQLLRSNGHRG